ncbi:hypothetical protein [Embleya sp. NPDC005575]|uniref:hypothetical protein n=1 Tax=Embleya sp. NPDC005575 TaxID=3156892 RepID=UPI0033A0C138
MFRTPVAAAPITDRTTTDAFSVLDTRTTMGTGLRIAAEAAAVTRRVASPAEPPRRRHRHEARITTPRPARTAAARRPRPAIDRGRPDADRFPNRPADTSRSL